MTSILGGTTSKFGGSMQAQGGVKITIPSFATAGGGQPRLALQSLQAAGQRQVSTFFDLSSDYVYFVTGMLTVQGNISNIVGPGVDVFPFLRQFSDACNVDKNNMQFTLGKGVCTATTATGSAASNASSTATLKGCLIQQIGLSVSVQDFVITQTAAMMALDIDV